MVPFCLHAVANTPAGLMETCPLVRSTNFGLPTNRGGSAPALSVSGPAQRSLTLRPACSPSRLATLCTRGFSSLVASTAALIATGWSEPVPGRVYPRCGPAPFTAHPTIRLMGSFDGSVCQLVPKLASMEACSIGGKKKLAEGLQQALTGKRAV